MKCCVRAGLNPVSFSWESKRAVTEARGGVGGGVQELPLRPPPTPPAPIGTLQLCSKKREKKKTHVETQTHMNTSIKLQVHVRAHMPRGVRRGAHRKEEGHES